MNLSLADTNPVTKLGKAEAIERINSLAASSIPFLLIADFECENNRVMTLDELPNEILYDINGNSNHMNLAGNGDRTSFDPYPPSYQDYKKRHEQWRLRETFSILPDMYLSF